MEEISDTLTMKRWWRFRTQPSLWSSFLQAMSCSRKHHVARKNYANTSHEWKNLMRINKKAKPNMIWKLQAATCSFWWDNWIEKGSLTNLCHNVRTPAKTPVKNFIQNNQWNIDNLQRIVPTHMVQQILKIEIGPSSQPDFTIWNLSHNRHYSNNSAWQINRNKRQTLMEAITPIRAMLEWVV
ncbi:uncharacterized protein [Nicotiana tomentosiformis]|uniref:uncharacterized protein n=1 Tax=Nicotiana tomentosiformis TaxID=4098 RepID=UPI00388C657B